MVDGACKISSINQSGGAGIEKKILCRCCRGETSAHRKQENRHAA